MKSRIVLGGFINDLSDVNFVKSSNLLGLQEARERVSPRQKP